MTVHCFDTYKIKTNVFRSDLKQMYERVIFLFNYLDCHPFKQGFLTIPGIPQLPTPNPGL